MKVISDAAANVQRRSSGSDKQRHGFMDRSPKSSCSSPSHSYINKSPNQSFSNQSPHNSYSDKSPKHSFTEKSPKHSFYENVPKVHSPKTSIADGTDDTEFLNKVSKFELISHNKATSPTVKSPVRVMPPDTPNNGSLGNNTLKRQNSSSGASPHTGEKVFTRETVTTRVPASILCGKSTPERVPSTGSTSSSSLTSVSSNSGVTLSWNSDSPKPTHMSPNSSKGNSPKSKSPQNSIAVTPKSVKEKKPINFTESATSKVRMATNAELLAESIINGDFLAGCDSTSESNRNTFDGMDFNFDELTASQQDLSIKHKEMVAERKKEQEQEKIEKQRLEEILSMCAEYEKQIAEESVCKDSHSPKPHTTAWSMQKFLDTNHKVSDGQGVSVPVKDSFSYSGGIPASNNTNLNTYSPSFSQSNAVSYSTSYGSTEKQIAPGQVPTDSKTQYSKTVENVNSPMMNGPYSPCGNTSVAPSKGTPPPVSPKPVMVNKTFDSSVTSTSGDMVSYPVTLSKQWTNQPSSSLSYSVTMNTSGIPPVGCNSGSNSGEIVSTQKYFAENSNKRLSLPDYENNIPSITDSTKLSSAVENVSNAFSSMDCYSDGIAQNKGNNSSINNTQVLPMTNRINGPENVDLGSECMSPRYDDNSFKVSQVQRPNQLPSFVDFTKEVHSLDRKEKSEYRGSMTKIKTNGSLTMLSSPSNSHKDFPFSTQVRRCSSNSSNSEEESTSGTNSEDTGTIKRRPDMNRNKENSLGGTCSPLQSPKLSPRMGSRSPQVSRRNFKIDNKPRDPVLSPTETIKSALNSLDEFIPTLNGVAFNGPSDQNSFNSVELNQSNDYLTNQTHGIYENLQCRVVPNGSVPTEKDQTVSGSRLSSGSLGSRKSDGRITPVNNEPILSKPRERIRSDSSNSSHKRVSYTNYYQVRNYCGSYYCY